MKIGELCSKNQAPQVLSDSSIKEVIVENSNKRLGATAVIENNQLIFKGNYGWPKASYGYSYSDKRNYLKSHEKKRI